ncbi:hypothetical protein N431DRAFT_387264 [Stipitochalara longipes BDJ]|nr:hypothetical protein N431DRAFT_387264 [Stipitochalara longipes BDJ]
MEEDPHDFYLGDIYARISRPFDCFLSTQAERDCREEIGRYHERIREISKGWHHLRYLADFMTVSTVPLRCRTLTPEDRHERLNRVNISVIEYGDELSSQDLRTPDGLNEFLDNLSHERAAPKHRLLVVQDLSTRMIEKLGSAFDIEPGFFRSHIGDYVWLNTRDPQAELPDLKSFSVKSNYFSAQYVSPRYFENRDQLNAAKAQAESFNILRRVDHDGRFKDWSDMPGSDVGLVRNKVSLWVRPNKGAEQGWLGVLLVDPTIDHGFPLWSGYGNFHPPPSLNTALERVTFPTYGNSVQEFLFWTLNRANTQPNTPPPSPDVLPSAFFTMIGAQWILMCEYINTRLGQVEWETELGLSHLYAQDFDHTLKTLLMWRRRLPIYHSFVERLISRLSVRYESTDSSPTSETWKDILTNFADILHRLEGYHCRADKIMAVSMAVTAREESKKATQESHAITRVSYLAFVFVPLNFWAAFFSMSGEFPVRTYWIYGAIAVPITVCVLGLLVFASSMGRWWRTIKEEKGKMWERKERVFRGGV